MISLTDCLSGVISFICSDLRRIDGYFTCVQLIRPLLRKPDFVTSAPGFYINVSGNLLNSVRLSYFTNNWVETGRIMQEFINRQDNVMVCNYEAPRVRNVSEKYGGDEARFRNFLHTYTQIGLDLLADDALDSRRLVAEYRLTYSPQRISSKPLLDPVFRKHSAFFNQLDSASVEQLWKDLDFWHPGGDWMHMLVNMLLPGDWIYMTAELRAFFLNPVPKPAVKGSVKEKLLEMFNLDMPDHWSPDD